MTTALVTEPWVRERLGISRNKVYQLVWDDLIPYVRVGKLVKFDPAAIESWIAQGGSR